MATLVAIATVKEKIQMNGYIFLKSIQMTSSPELLIQFSWYFVWSIWGTALYKMAKIIPVGS